MNVTQIKIKLSSDPDERLKAFCSICLENEIAIRDIKLIDGGGGLFVAMPSRKVGDFCDRCGQKNNVTAKFCNQCGLRLPEERVKYWPDGRKMLYSDIVFPVNRSSRQQIQTAIIDEFQAELLRSKQPGYKPADLDILEK